MSSELNASAPPISPYPEGPLLAPELAAHVAAKVCHDLISPVGAIVSGLDLMEEDDSPEMREEAMRLIADSARKLSATLVFSRVAYGASASADTFDPRELETLAQGVFAHVRAQLDWAVEAPSLDKPAARAVLNLAQIGGAALPTGGVARVTAAAEGDRFVIGLDARGPRARLRAETAQGLQGLPLGDGLAGLWIQAYYLYALVTAAGGTLSVDVQDEHVSARIRLPLQS